MQFSIRKSLRLHRSLHTLKSELKHLQLSSVLIYCWCVALLLYNITFLILTQLQMDFDSVLRFLLSRWSLNRQACRVFAANKSLKMSIMGSFCIEFKRDHSGPLFLKSSLISTESEHCWKMETYLISVLLLSVCSLGFTQGADISKQFLLSIERVLVHVDQFNHVNVCF